nr:alpha/beta hydrolase [Microbacterium amylolyticum]
MPNQALEQKVALPVVRRENITLADGRTLSALVYGTGAPRAFFVHGAGLNAHTWDRTILSLAEPAIAIDLPGHGESSWRNDGAYTPELLAPDLAAALAAWATGPVALIGHSLGGLAALLTAAHHPGTVSSLTLVDIVPGAGREGASGLAEFFRRLDFASVEDAVDHAMSFSLGGSREAARRGVLLNTRTRADGRIEWKHHMARIFSPSDDTPRVASDPEAGWRALEDVTVPVTLVAASRGFLSPDDITRFRAHQPHARVVTLDASHNVQEGAFVALAREISTDIPREVRP